MSRVDRPRPNGVRRALLTSVVVIAGVVGLSACGADSDAAADDATVLDIKLGRFVLDPAVLTASPGNLRLRVTNVDPAMVHDLVVHGRGTRPLGPGESQTIEVPDVAAGEYRMWCDIPGHAAMGQTGTLVVNAAPTPSATSS